MGIKQSPAIDLAWHRFDPSRLSLTETSRLPSGKQTSRRGSLTCPLGETRLQGWCKSSLQNMCAAWDEGSSKTCVSLSTPLATHGAAKSQVDTLQNGSPSCTFPEVGACSSPFVLSLRTRQEVRVATYFDCCNERGLNSSLPDKKQHPNMLFPGDRSLWGPNPHPKWLAVFTPLQSFFLNSTKLSPQLPEKKRKNKKEEKKEQKTTLDSPTPTKSHRRKRKNQKKNSRERESTSSLRLGLQGRQERKPHLLPPLPGVLQQLAGQHLRDE